MGYDNRNSLGLEVPFSAEHLRLVGSLRKPQIHSIICGYRICDSGGESSYLVIALFSDSALFSDTEFSVCRLSLNNKETPSSKAEVMGPT